MTKPRSPEPTYSMRLLQPFLELQRGRIPEEAMRAFEAIDPDTRVPVCYAIKLLDDSVRQLRDPDLGLKAARIAAQGDYDLLEYAMVTAQTVREANEILQRYVRLLNTALDYSLEIHGDLAITWFDDSDGSLRGSLPEVPTESQTAIINQIWKELVANDK